MLHRVAGEPISGMKSNRLRRFDGARVADIPGVQRTSGFEEQHVDLFRCARPVFHPARNDHEFAGSHFEAALFSGFVAKLHAKFALNYQEELVFVVVMVPHEFALKLDQLDMLAVQFTDDSGAPMVLERGQLVPQRDLLHRLNVANGSPK